VRSFDKKIRNESQSFCHYEGRNLRQIFVFLVVETVGDVYDGAMEAERGELGSWDDF
jgi:hypothetical protein